MLIDMLMSLQPASSGRQMADAAAEAAGTAVNKVADAESDQRERSEGASTSGSPHAVVEISDAVLQQRTYFVPTMVGALYHLCHQMTICLCHDLSDLPQNPSQTEIFMSQCGTASGVATPDVLDNWRPDMLHSHCRGPTVLGYCSA